eukprot:6212037-Pleurochrysis_carterae.AAC.1
MPPRLHYLSWSQANKSVASIKQLFGKRFFNFNLYLCGCAIKFRNGIQTSMALIRLEKHCKSKSSNNN